MKLEAMSDAEISAICEQGHGILRKRRLLKLLAEECDCDRYACPSCLALQAYGKAEIAAAQAEMKTVKPRG